jgi:hypothetical protein
VRIRRLRFDRWGTLSAEVALDPERLGLLVVETDRQRDDLVAALEAILSGSNVEPRGAPGLLEAELEPVCGEAVRRDRSFFRARRDDELTPATVLWRVGGDVSALPPVDPPEFPGPRDSAFRTLADGWANPWIIDGDALSEFAGLADVVGWLRRRIDSREGHHSAEDVEAALQAVLARYDGLLVSAHPVSEEVARLDRELSEIGAEAGSLEEDRREAAAALARLERARRSLAALSGPLAELEGEEARAKLAHVDDRLAAHRKAHARLKLLRRELRLLSDMESFPPVARMRDLERELATWHARRLRAAELAESVVDIEGTLARCRTAEARRAWCATAFPAVGSQVEELTSRGLRVDQQIRAAQAAAGTEVSRTGAEGAIVQEFAELDRHVRDVIDPDREFVLDSFPGVLDSFFAFVSMSRDLSRSESRLTLVRGLQYRIHAAAVLLAIVGVAFAVGVPAADWSRPDVIDTPVLVGAGVFLLALGAGTWFSAGGILTRRRLVLEGQVTGLTMPLELEGLRLSVVELRMTDICRKHGYESGEELARDLSRHGKLAKLDLTAAYRRAMEETRRITVSELAPLKERARALLSTHAFPPLPHDPLDALIRVGRELRTHVQSCRMIARLEQERTCKGEELRALDPAQVELLSDLRSRLADAGVHADPASDPDGVLADLVQRRRRWSRWVAIRTREVPRALALLLAPGELARARRERRRIVRRGDPGGGGLLGGPIRTLAPSAAAALARRLTIARRRCAALDESERQLVDEASRRLHSYHRRLPALLSRRNQLLAARDRAALTVEAVETALEGLRIASRRVRSGLSQILNEEAIPRWTRARTQYEGARFELDLALSLPHGADHNSAYDSRLAHLAVRAALASRGGPTDGGCPLVLVEPFERAGPVELVSLVAFLVTHVVPHPQVVIVTRRRSRYEKVRWEQPVVFKRIQIIEL